MSRPTVALAPKLRQIRVDRGYSLDTVAKGTGLSKAFLSLVETGQSDISLGRLLKVVGFYGIRVSDLLGEHGGNGDTDGKVRDLHEHEHVSSATEGLDIEILADHRLPALLPMLMTLEPRGQTAEPARHHGEEFVYVLSGKLLMTAELEDGTVTLTLGPGDSYHFAAAQPHRYACLGESVVKALLVVTPPTL